MCINGLCDGAMLYTALGFIFHHESNILEASPAVIVPWTRGPWIPAPRQCVSGVFGYK